jgi:hypothetical protein
MNASGFDIVRAKSLMRRHLELSHQHRKLDDQNRSRSGGDRKQRLRSADGESFVCHGILH